MSVDDLVVVQGWHQTRLSLERWHRRPAAVLAPWIALSAAITFGLLLAVYAVAELSTPDPTPIDWPGLTSEPTLGDYGRVLYRNSLVLALHAMACVAGFMAGSSMPLAAAQRTGLSRWVHEKAGPLAIGFVIGATLFSLSTQAYTVGGTASSLSFQLGLRPGELIVGLLPHAVPELTALFLPLAAWMIASRRGRWHELLAATFVTVAISMPVLLVAAVVELYVSPELIRALAGV